MKNNRIWIVVDSQFAQGYLGAFEKEEDALEYVKKYIVQRGYNKIDSQFIDIFDDFIK